MKGSISARPMAIIKLKMPDGTVENLKMGIGDSRHDIKVLAIESEQIEVQDAKGNKGSISRGKAKKLHIKR